MDLVEPDFSLVYRSVQLSKNLFGSVVLSCRLDVFVFVICGLQDILIQGNVGFRVDARLRPWSQAAYSRCQ